VIQTEGTYKYCWLLQHNTAQYVTEKNQLIFICETRILKRQMFTMFKVYYTEQKCNTILQAKCSVSNEQRHTFKNFHRIPASQIPQSACTCRGWSCNMHIVSTVTELLNTKL